MVDSPKKKKKKEEVTSPIDIKKIDEGCGPSPKNKKINNQDLEIGKWQKTINFILDEENRENGKGF